MTVAKAAYHLVKTVPTSMESEKEPDILWGLGTPNGAIEPFVSVQKGSLYFAVDNTDDQTHIYQKVDEGGDNADWVRMFVENQALIDNNDLAASAGVVGSKLATNARRQFAVSKEFDIDNGAGTTDDDIILSTSDGCTVVSAAIVYTVATDSAGAAAANAKIGTTVGGSQVVETTALEVSKAVGSRTAMVLETGAGVLNVDAGGFLCVRHTGVTATEAGKYKVVVEYQVDD